MKENDRIRKECTDKLDLLGIKYSWLTTPTGTYFGKLYIEWKGQRYVWHPIAKSGYKKSTNQLKFNSFDEFLTKLVFRD